MNASETLKIGDVVYFNNGTLCAEEFGAVTEFEPTRRGVIVWVRKSNGGDCGLETLAGSVPCSSHVDSTGVRRMYARHTPRIGAYKATFSA